MDLYPLPAVKGQSLAKITARKQQNSPRDCGRERSVGRKRELENTTGKFNTATGQGALTNNIGADGNTANVFFALHDNTAGKENTAIGQQALAVSQADANTAIGFQALNSNDLGGRNTACGHQALLDNTTGDNNTAVGHLALFHSTGRRNTAIGESAGASLTSGDNNVDINNLGSAGESGTIRIGTSGAETRAFIAGISGVSVTGAAVLVSIGGQLGVAASSARFKKDIQSMNQASDALLALRPVTFQYKEEIDPQGIPQFGLIAEEVAKVNPALVTRDANGEL
jgi:hypothetical protein